MGQSTLRKSLLTILGVVALALLAYQLRASVSPARESQAALVDLQGVEPLRAQFNEDEGRLRLILLLSPT